MRRKKIILSTAKNLIVWIVSLIMLVPMVLIIINSFKERYEASSMSMQLPAVWHFDNYLTVITEGKLVQSFLNSLLYSGVSGILCIVLTTMAAFVLARRKTVFNKFIYFYIILGIALPMNYISLTKVMQLTHLNNTQIGVCLLYAAMQIPFTVFLMYGFINSVPRELDEAGIIDGCTPVKLFFSIIFPLLKPVVVTAVVLNFMNSWNEFITPLYYLNNASLWPMTLAVYNFFGQFQMSWNLVSADIVLTSLPAILIYLLGQKYIVSGMTNGAVKG
jgi:raffinose/stachyose/melibiose transport system permease protein